MGKVLLFIFEGMTDFEITFVSHLLSTSGNKEIITIAYEGTPIKARSGLTIKPTKLVSEVLDSDVDGLIIPGGWYGNLKGELIDLIKKLKLEGKLLAGICGAGTIFLAKSGALTTVKYTTPVKVWTEKHSEIFTGDDPFSRENFIDKRVVRDNNIITAQGNAFIDFAVEICDYFQLFQDNMEKEEFLKDIKGS